LKPLLARSHFAFTRIVIQVEEVAIITDRTTGTGNTLTFTIAHQICGIGRSKGYGFITFRDMDAAYRALDEPTKDIDVRTTLRVLLNNRTCVYM
jgi:RNA recognition motif-containing protein